MKLSLMIEFSATVMTQVQVVDGGYSCGCRGELTLPDADLKTPPHASAGSNENIYSIDTSVSCRKVLRRS